MAQLGHALELLDKTTTLLSTKDPLAYQAVQAMHGQYADVDYDPSDAAEARRTEEHEGEVLNADDERDFLRSIGADFS